LKNGLRYSYPNLALCYPLLGPLVTVCDSRSVVGIGLSVGNERVFWKKSIEMPLGVVSGVRTGIVSPMSPPGKYGQMRSNDCVRRLWL